MTDPTTPPLDPHAPLDLSGAEVVRVLDLSIRHLPETLGRFELPSHANVLAFTLPTGWLMFVPEDPIAVAEETDEPPALEVLRIQLYARALDCDYVLFDEDGPRVAGLRVYW